MNDISGQLSSILNGCDKEQLNKYLNDEASTDLLIKSLDKYRQLTEEEENLRVEVKSLAESILAKAPVLAQHKQQLQPVVDEFEKAKREYVQTKEAYDALAAVGDDMSLAAVYNQLQAQASRSEEESDESADAFFCTASGQHTDEELNAFQRKFLEARAQAHILKIKADKMHELMPNNH